MDALQGIWRLVDSRAWDKRTKSWTAPYGANLMGQLTFSNGRMLSVACNGDAGAKGERQRNYSSYGGTYTFDGITLEALVDIASDPSRVGIRQARGIVMMGEQMLLRPPQRVYGDSVQRRELVWERIWRPEDTVP
jgi:hypothetical protein